MKRFRPIAVPLVVAALLALPAAAQAQAYVRVGGALDMPEDTTFEDIDCSSTRPPALFGCVAGSDGEPLGTRGGFDNGAAFEAGIGARIAPSLRVEAIGQYRFGRDYAGQADFLGAGQPDEQPVSSELESWSAFAAGWYDAIEAGEAGELGLFVGGGVGLAHHSLDPVLFEFPAIGPDATTLIAGGDRTQFAWFAGGGASYRLSDRATLELSYRYSDLGGVGTDAGSATIVRPTHTLTLDIAGIEGDLSTHSIWAGLRFGF